MPTMPTTLGFTRLLTTLFIGAIICMGLCGAAQSARAEDVVDDGVIAHDVGHHKRTIENLFLFYQNIVPFEANGRESEAALLKKHKKEAIQVLSRFSQSSIGYSPEYALSSINEVIAEYLEKHKRTVVSTQESVDYRTAAAQVLTQYDPEHVTYILNFARFAFNLIKGFDVHTASAGNVEERSRWEEKFSWRASSIASLLAAPVLLAHAQSPEDYVFSAAVGSIGLVFLKMLHNEMRNHANSRERRAREFLTTLGIQYSKSESRLVHKLMKGDIEPMRRHLCEMALDPGPVQPSPAVHVRIDVAPVVEQQAIKDETELIEDDRVDVQAVSPGLKAMRER